MDGLFDNSRAVRVLSEATRARRHLSLGDVLQAGLPAVYLGYGDRLLFMDGTIYDATDPHAPEAILRDVVDNPALAVGFEFGWRHAPGCVCSFCAARPAQATA